jgi:hypothetical protein
MIEDPADNKSVSKFSKAVLEINWEYYGRFVRKSEHTLKIELGDEVRAITEPGIYKLLPKDRSEIYVGEAKNLSKRLSNYQNAGFELHNPNVFTNRRIQGWMLNLIDKTKAPIEIFVLTESTNLSKDGEKLNLDLKSEINGKYNRELIEHIEIANSANKFRIQNDPCNWKKNQDKC